MNRVVPPFCLLLALAMLIIAICLLAVGPPEASVDLHEARAAGDDVFVNVWESDLVQRQRIRLATIVGLLAGSVGITIVAFRTMSSER